MVITLKSLNSPDYKKTESSNDTSISSKPTQLPNSYKCLCLSDT